MVRLLKWHRKFRLHLPLGTGIAVAASGKLGHQMPTNPLPVRTFYPVKSIDSLEGPIANHDIFTYFWCHKFWCPTESACAGPIPHLFFAKTVIRNLDMAIQSQHDVVEFEIAVNDSILVKILQSKADLSSIKPITVSTGGGIRESVPLTVRVYSQTVHVEYVTSGLRR